MKKGEKKPSEKKKADAKPDKDSEVSSGSGLLDDCKKAFDTNNLYQVFGLEKATATLAEIKKAYYKLSLKHHPDKVSDSSKSESNFKFQVLGKCYSILSDAESKKLYDDTGVVDGEDSMFSKNSSRDWDEYFRTLFNKVTKDDIAKFFAEYKNSAEERADLIRFYTKHKGDMDLVLEEVWSEDVLEDEERYRQILLDAIEKDEAPKYDKFVNESKKKATKRKAHYEKEAKEADEMKKEMGIDESQDSLRNAILARRKNQNDNFLDNLTKKYSKMETKEKTKKPVGRPKKKKSVSKSASDEDVENKDSLDEKEDDDEDDSEEDDENDEATPAKRSSLVKKKAPTSSSKKTSAKPALKKRVKRL